MSAAFHRAAIPKPFTVLGRRLRPFSIGHEILLAAGGNSFSRYHDGSPAEEFPNLALAVRICSLDYDSAIHDVMYHQGRIAAWLFVARYSRYSIPLEALKFQAYLSHYRSGPEFTQRGESSESSPGTPFEYTLKVFLCSKMGLTVSEAMNYPYCTALADYIAHMESKGQIFVVDSLKETEEETARIHEEILKEVGANGRIL